MGSSCDGTCACRELQLGATPAASTCFIGLMSSVSFSAFDRAAWAKSWAYERRMRMLDSVMGHESCGWGISTKRADSARLKEDLGQ